MNCTNHVSWTTLWSCCRCCRPCFFRVLVSRTVLLGFFFCIKSGISFFLGQGVDTFWLKWLCSSSTSNGRAKETFAAASCISSAQILLYHQVFICFPLGEKGGTESSKIEDRLGLEGKSSRMVGKFWNDNTNWFFVFVSWSFFQCSTTSVIFVWVCKRIWLGLGLRGPGWVEQYGVLCSRFCDSAVVACTCKVHLHLRERPYARSDFCRYLHLLAWFLMENLAWSIKPVL